MTLWAGSLLDFESYALILHPLADIQRIQLNTFFQSTVLVEFINKSEEKTMPIKAIVHLYNGYNKCCHLNYLFK